MDKIIPYLKELKKNNNINWYHKNKGKYENASDELEDMLQAVITNLGKEDPAIANQKPKDLILKEVRDTRYTPDKAPFTIALRAHIGAEGKKPIPVGYDVEIRLNNESFMGGGLFTHLFKEATKRVRDYICEHEEEFGAIINNPKFKEKFEIKGEILKNVPKEYDPDCKMADYLKYKSWYLKVKIEEKSLEDKKALTLAMIETFKLMKPFNDFLNEALGDFRVPTK